MRTAACLLLASALLSGCVAVGTTGNPQPRPVANSRDLEAGYPTLWGSYAFPETPARRSSGRWRSFRR